MWFPSMDFTFKGCLKKVEGSNIFSRVSVGAVCIYVIRMCSLYSVRLLCADGLSIYDCMDFSGNSVVNQCWFSMHLA